MWCKMWFSVRQRVRRPMGLVNCTMPESSLYGRSNRCIERRVRRKHVAYVNMQYPEPIRPYTTMIAIIVRPKPSAKSTLQCMVGYKRWAALIYRRHGENEWTYTIKICLRSRSCLWKYEQIRRAWGHNKTDVKPVVVGCPETWIDRRRCEEIWCALTTKNTPWPQYMFTLRTLLGSLTRSGSWFWLLVTESETDETRSSGSNSVSSLSVMASLVLGTTVN